MLRGAARPAPGKGHHAHDGATRSTPRLPRASRAALRNVRRRLRVSRRGVQGCERRELASPSAWFPALGSPCSLSSPSPCRGTGSRRRNGGSGIGFRQGEGGPRSGVKALWKRAKAATETARAAAVKAVLVDAADAHAARHLLRCAVAAELREGGRGGARGGEPQRRQPRHDRMLPAVVTTTPRCSDGGAHRCCALLTIVARLLLCRRSSSSAGGPRRRRRRCSSTCGSPSSVLPDHRLSGVLAFEC